MNRVNLIGRLTKTPELRYTQSNKGITRFTIAVNRKFKNSEGDYDADFINCLCFEKRAKVITNYCEKGDLIGVAGRIQTGSYTGQDGQKRYTTDVIVDEIDLLSAKKKENSQASPYDYQKEENNTETSDPFSDFGEQVSIDDNFLD